MTTTARLTKLRKDRRMVRYAVITGITASLIANAIGSETILNAGVAMWPPVALLWVLEILPRIPIGRWYSTLARVSATLGVATAAGWLSYFHMASMASQHGERGVNAYVWPISVDGLMTVAAVALVEIGARIRMLENDTTAVQPELTSLTPAESYTPVAAVLDPRLPEAPVSGAPTRTRPGALGLMVEKPLPPARRAVRSMRVLSKES